MTNDKNIIVSLGKQEALSEDNIKLEKLVEDCKDKNFRKVLDYMLTTREDSLNPAYNSEEEDLRSEIARWRESGNSGDGKFCLFYQKQDNSYADITGEDAYVRDYSDIILEKTRNSEFGESIRYNGINLIARFEPIGGR